MPMCGSTRTVGCCIKKQPGVGHYGLFNGRRFTTTIAPRIKAFMQAHR